MRKIIGILLLLLVLLDASSQILTYKELNKVRTKKEWADIDKFLSAKGWVAERPELLADRKVREVVWNYASVSGIVKLKVEKDWKDKSDVTLTFSSKMLATFRKKMIEELEYEEQLSLKNKRFHKLKNELILEKRLGTGDVTFLYSTKDDKYWGMLKSTRRDPDVRSLDTYQIGDYIEEEGGILFYVSEDADYGYILAMSDVGNGSGCEWGPEDVDIPGEYPYTSKEWHHVIHDLDGENNTDAIAKYIDTNYHALKKYAVHLAKGYRGGGRTDWYLPSEGQLKIVNDMLEHINSRLRANGGVSMGKFWYWSSSEYDKTFAWAVNMGNKIVGRSSKRGTDRVRAVRTMRIEE